MQTQQQTPGHSAFGATDRFDLGAMQEFMRRPDVYWSAVDALAPPPEEHDFAGYLAHPDVWTVAGTFQGHIIGYVLFNKRTSIGAEIHVGFHPSCRGRIAKSVIEHAIGLAFMHKRLLKLWAIVPSDNRPAIWLARTIGFVPEGRLTNAVVRQVEGERGSLRDLIVLGLSKGSPS